MLLSATIADLKRPPIGSRLVTRGIRLFWIDRRGYLPIVPVRTHDETCAMQHEPAIEMQPDEKLRWIRRLDGTRHWQFLDDRRFCRCCWQSFTGREVLIVGGTR